MVITLFYHYTILKEYYTGSLDSSTPQYQVSLSPQFRQAIQDRAEYCGWTPESPLPPFETSIQGIPTTSMKGLFRNIKNCSRLDLSQYDTSLIQDMSYLFSKCSNLTEVSLASFNWSSCKDIRYAFKNTKIKPSIRTTIPILSPNDIIPT